MLRVLHTSDWHLGHTLHDYERSAEQRHVLAWLLDQLVAEQIDALLIAGDVFDHTNPAAAAQQLFYRFLAAAHRRLPHLDIVIIAGNHDCAGCLEAPAAVLHTCRVRVIGAVRYSAAGELDTERLVVPLHDATGQCAAWCVAVPFLRYSDLPPRQPPAATPDLLTAPADQPDEHAAAYTRGVAAVYQAATAHALAQRTAPNQALIAMGHCHMIGGHCSADSERRLVIGGAEALPATVFADAISYAALGHLHRAQTVANQSQVRYAGSLLPLSFAEEHYRHQVLRVTFDGAQIADITPLPVPRPVALVRVPAQPAPLAEVITQLRNWTPPAQPLTDVPPYVQVRVLLTAPEPTLRQQIDEALAAQPVRLARIEVSYGSALTPAAAVSTPMALEELERLQPHDVFTRLYHSRYHQPPSAELLATLAEALVAVESGNEC